MGKYDLNSELIPAKPRKPNCVKFKDSEDSPNRNTVSTVISTALPVLFLHEMLHAICFKEDGYLFVSLQFLPVYA